MFNIKKRNLPKRTGPLNLYQCDNYSSTAACKLLIMTHLPVVGLYIYIFICS